MASCSSLIGSRQIISYSKNKHLASYNNHMHAKGINKMKTTKKHHFSTAVCQVGD